MLGKDRGFSFGILILHFSLSLGSTLIICWEVPLLKKKSEQIVLEVQMQGNFKTQVIFAPCFYQLSEKSHQSPLESPPHSSWESWFLRVNRDFQSQQRLLLAVRTHAMLPPAVQKGKCPAAACAFGGLPQVFRMPFPACGQPRKENAWSTCCVP